ncbi:MAG: flagellar brake protein [Comamonadaceae bacterium]
MTDHIDKSQESSADPDKYMVHGRIEIAAILSAICKTGSVVTATLDGVADDFILTSMIAIRPEQNCVLLDCGANADANRRALTAGKIVCTTVLDGIRIQMTCQAFGNVQFEGREVFSMAMPESLLRLQRREYYRIGTPRTHPLVCDLTPAAGVIDVAHGVVIVNISCGGISVIDSQTTAKLETGTVLRMCHIVLPEFGVVTADIVIRGSVEVTFRSGLRDRRSGWEFTGMLERERSLIQRYITKLEHEHRHRGISA